MDMIFLSIRAWGPSIPAVVVAFFLCAIHKPLLQLPAKPVWLCALASPRRHPSPQNTHCSRGVQPGGIYVYVGTARADPRRSGVGRAPRPQARPMPAAALIIYITFRQQPQD
jgi:hypothetical protein